MAWKGSNDDTGIYTATFDDATETWSTPGPRLAGRGTSASPALVSFQNTLFMFWKGIGDDHTVWFSSIDSGGIWRPQQQVNYFTTQPNGGIPHAIGTSGAPSATVQNNAILLAWKGADPDSTIYTSLFEDGEFSGQVQFAEAGTANSPGVTQISNLTLSPSGTPQTQATTLIAWRGAADDQTIWFSQINSTA
jgi:hypothetical protein